MSSTDWTLHGIIPTSQVDSFLSDKNVSIRTTDHGKGGMTKLFVCRQHTKFGCRYRVKCKYFTISDTVEVFSQSEHDHSSGPKNDYFISPSIHNLVLECLSVGMRPREIRHQITVQGLPPLTAIQLTNLIQRLKKSKSSGNAAILNEASCSTGDSNSQTATVDVDWQEPSPLLNEIHGSGAASPCGTSGQDEPPADNPDNQPAGLKTGDPNFVGLQDRSGSGMKSSPASLVPVDPGDPGEKLVVTESNGDSTHNEHSVIDYSKAPVRDTTEFHASPGTPCSSIEVNGGQNVGNPAESVEPAGGDGIKCGICGLSVGSIGALQMHTLQAHSVQELCNSSGREGSGAGGPPGTGIGRARHPGSGGNRLRRASDDQIYACDTCNRSFDSILAVHNHKRSGCLGEGGSPKVKTLEFCDICKIELDLGQSLEMHNAECHAYKHSCPECGQQFEEFGQLESHAVAEHYLEKHIHYICSACGKSFDSPDDLQRHLLDVHALQIYKCALCKQLFDSRVDVQVHFAVTHSQQALSFACRFCRAENQVFDSEDALRFHVTLMHLGQPPEAVSLSVSDMSYNHSPGTGSISSKSGDFPKTMPNFPKMPDLIRWCDNSLQKSGISSGSGGSSEGRAFACKLCPESFNVEFLYERHMESAHGTQLFSNMGSSSEHHFSQSAAEAVQQSAADIWMRFAPGGPSEAKRPRSSDKNPSPGLSAMYQSLPMGNLTPNLQTAEPTTAKCSICDKVCDTSAELAEHRLTHCRVTSSDKCTVCRKNLSCLEDYFIHSHEHNGQGNGQSCIICKQTLSSSIELHFHGKFHLNGAHSQPINPISSKTPPTSQTSPIRFGGTPTSQSGLATAIGTQSTQNGNTPLSQALNLSQDAPSGSGANTMPYQCIKCQAFFSSEEEIKAHVTTHMLQEGINHPCHLCSDVFDSPSKLQCHLIDHSFSGHSEYECYLCGSVFTMAQGLQQHMFMHPFEERQYVCELEGCTKKFFFRAELDNHQISDHKAGLHRTGSGLKNHDAASSSSAYPCKTFKCGNCDKQFPTLELVAVHRRFCNPNPTHNTSGGKGDFDWSKLEGATSFPCSRCPKVFSSLSALQGHSHIHMSGNRGMNQPCSKCDKVFSSYSKLRNHQRCHNKDLNGGSCGGSGNGSKKNRDVSSPKTPSSDILLQPSPFICEICGKAFSRRDHLKTHQKTHSRSNSTTPETFFSGGLPTLVPPKPLGSVCSEKLSFVNEMAGSGFTDTDNSSESHSPESLMINGQ